MKHKTSFTPDDLKKIESMAALRLPNDHIATIMGVSHDTFERMMKTDDTLRACVLRGRANASHRARATLFETAFGRRKVNPRTGKPGRWEARPYFPAMKFWMQTQEGFKTTDKLELTGADGKPIETREMTKEERMAAIRELDKKLKLTDDE